MPKLESLVDLRADMSTVYRTQREITARWFYDSSLAREIVDWTVYFFRRQVLRCVRDRCAGDPLKTLPTIRRRGKAWDIKWRAEKMYRCIHVSKAVSFSSSILRHKSDDDIMDIFWYECRILDSIWEKVFQSIHHFMFYSFSRFSNFSNFNFSTEARFVS